MIKFFQFAILYIILSRLQNCNYTDQHKYENSRIIKCFEANAYLCRVALFKILILSILFYSCKKDANSDLNQFITHDSNASKSLFILDSMYLFGSYESSIHAFDTLPASLNKSSQDYYHCRKLIHRVLYGKTQLDLNLKDISFSDKWHYHMATEAKNIYDKDSTVNISRLKTITLNQKNWLPAILGNALIGQYYFRNKLDIDSSWVYFRKCENLLNKCIYNTSLHHLVFEYLIKLSIYKRQDFNTVYYSNILIDSTRYLQLDSQWMALALLSSSDAMMRVNKMDDAFADSSRAYSLIYKKKIPSIMEEYYKNELYLYLLSNQRNKLDSLIENHILLFNKNHIQNKINYYRILGYSNVMENKQKKALIDLYMALQEENQNYFPNIAVLNNLRFLISSALTADEKYSLALHNIDIGNKEIDKYVSNSPYLFVSQAQKLDILYQAYLNTKKINHLYLGKNIIEQMDSLLYMKMNSEDERVIINFFRENQGYYPLILDIYAALYNKTNDENYKERMLITSDKSKSMLMLRDMNLQKNVNAESYLVRLTSELKMESIKGVRNNANFNMLQFKMMLLEDSKKATSLQEMSDDFYKNFKLTDFLGKINPNHIIIDFKKTANYIVITSLKNNSIGTKIFKNEMWINESILFDSLDLHVRSLVDGMQYITLLNDEANSLNTTPCLVKKDNVRYQNSLKFLNCPDTETGKRTVAFAFSDKETILNRNQKYLPELPGTLKEVLDLKKNDCTTVIYTGRNATKENFIKEYQDSQTRSIHLALHGISNGGKLDDTKLYFRTKDGGIDSLYGFELLKYKSKASKVVLSACETLKGVTVTSEGSYSLTRYFLINGAKEVWSNYDRILDYGERKKFFVYGCE